jgi:hypothetical protein
VQQRNAPDQTLARHCVIVQCFSGSYLRRDKMNVFESITLPVRWFMTLLLVFFVAGCNGGGSGVSQAVPTVLFTVPASASIGVALNASINATFSEAMDPLTITSATFSLMQGATSVPGSVRSSGTTAAFYPTSNLVASTVYTATLTTGVKDLAGNALAITKTWSFTTGTTADITVPTVSSVIPANAAVGIALNASVAATFSEAMDPLTITSATFTLMQGTTPVAGTVSYVGTTATFHPTSNLVASTAYTATLTTGVKNLSSNALASNYSWSFTTGATVDTTPPTVLSTVPASALTGVAINASVNATFSKVMNPLTITSATFSLMQGTTPVAGTVSYVGRTATFTPTSNLTASTVYTATITTGVKDLAGNVLAATKTWSFTTGATLDTTPPTVSSTAPLDVATGVALNSTVNATFSKVMDVATFTTTTFTLKQATTVVPGAVTYVGTTATFSPTSNLVASTVYTATITTGVKDLAGNALAVTKTWSFTTGVTVAKGPAPVNLGTAGNFAILAETGVSTTGTTAITGDVGVSPVAATYLTGFSLIADSTNVFSTSSLVTGKLYAANYAVPTPANMTTAVSDIMIAYTDAAGRTLPDQTELGAGDISGLTLVPGLYKWGTGVLISTNVTLNGGPNDVWIFQISGDLTMASGARMVLAGGALPKNIFWQVAGGAGAVLGTTAHFEGVILTAKAITLNTGATGNGRLLAQTAVTLDSNAVTQPAP